MARGIAGGLDCILAGDDPNKRFRAADGRHLAAAVLEAREGPAPEGAWVLHGCHDGNCINGDHLYYGTEADNGLDRSAVYQLGLKALRDLGVQLRNGQVTDLPLGRCTR